MFPEYNLNEISQLYSTNQQQRYSSLIQKFTQNYHCKPDFIARAPGRVNIIGQHIDYEGYGVFPSAIQKDCLIAVKVNPDSEELEIYHFDSQNYPNFKTSKSNLKVSQTKQEYPNKYLSYLLAGYHAGVQNIKKKQLVGMQLMITGNIPIGSGVSSSAALVVCAGVASLYANKQKNTQTLLQFTESCIFRERQCGVACGGMDQSISIMGKLDSCLYIQFNPIRCEKVAVPKGCKLIIMNSLVENLKVNSAVFRYNKRVVECRLGLFLMANNLGIQQTVYKQWKVLKELQQYLNLSIRMTSFLVEKSIEQKKYTKKDIQDLLGHQIWQFLSDIQLCKQVLQENEQFCLFQAVKHVYEQSQRVKDLIEICNSTLPDLQKNVFFGKLMNESHESCKNVYKCSCQELDELTSTALKNGALGSRLTGAGWGGCTVSLVEDGKVTEFIERMKAEYYAKQPYKSRSVKQGLQNVIFQSKPAEGACVIVLEDVKQ